MKPKSGKRETKNCIQTCKKETKRKSFESKPKISGPKVDEIDDLFLYLQKGKHIEKHKEEKEKSKEKLSTKGEILGNKDDIFGSNTTTGRKKTEEGFSIYTEEELGFGKAGGGSELCPFDCDCCF